MIYSGLFGLIIHLRCPPALLWNLGGSSGTELILVQEFTCSCLTGANRTKKAKRLFYILLLRVLSGVLRESFLPEVFQCFEFALECFREVVLLFHSASGPRRYYSLSYCSPPSPLTTNSNMTDPSPPVAAVLRWSEYKRGSP